MFLPQGFHSRNILAPWLLSVLCVLSFSGCTQQIAPIQPVAEFCATQMDCEDGTRCHQGYCLTVPLTCDGNGQLGPGEACDDGNEVDEDGCTRDCQLAACGDGILR